MCSCITFVFCRASSRHFLFGTDAYKKTESKTACISQKSVSGLICQENDFAHVPIKQQSLTLPLYTTAALTRSSWDIPPSEELPPFSLRKALPTRNTLARRRGSVCTWGPNWRSISITWLEERWENREHCWRFSRASGGREGRGTPLAARGE